MATEQGSNFTHMLSAFFYIQVHSEEINHPAWWKFWGKATIVRSVCYQWVSKCFPVNQQEAGLILSNSDPIGNPYTLTILRAMSGCDIVDITNIQLESWPPETAYIKTHTDGDI